MGVLPNKEAGLAPTGLEFAFTTGDDSIPGAALRTQEAVTEQLKQRMQESEGWGFAHESAFADLPFGIPLITGIFFKLADQLWDLTGLGNVFKPSDVLEWISNLPIFSYIIPPLDASKIVTGQFAIDIIDGLVDTAGYILDSLIPGLNASKIVAGLLNALRIPGLDGSKIVSGTISQAFLSITSIAGNIITGVIGSGNIPSLDASKITSGSFAQSMITGLVTSLANLLPKSIFNALVGSGSNLVTDPVITNATIWGTAGASPTQGVSTEQYLSGTTSYKAYHATNGSYASVELIRTADGATTKIETREGERFYIEGYVMAKAGNAATRNCFLQAAWEDSTGVNATTYSTTTQTMPTSTGFTKLSGYVTCPAGRDRVRFQAVANSTGSIAGDSYYWDNFQVREVTEGQNIVQRLFGAVGSLANSVLTSVIPGLDGSKIVSGSIAQTFLNITSIGANIITGVLDALRIPGLDGSKIVSGTISQTFLNILDIPANIISGVLDALRIPGLDGSKITSGTISQTFLNITSIGANIITGVLDAARIPLIALNKLASDVVNGGKFVLGLIPNLIASLIPNLDASKITTGTFSQAMVNITSIGANLITGVLDALRIPALDASKISTGSFAQSRITDLVTDLGNRVLSSIFRGTVRSGANLIPDPGFNDASLDAARLGGGTGGTGSWSYDATIKRSGTKSLKYTHPGGTIYPAMWFPADYSITFNSADLTQFFSVRPGQRHWVSFWVYAPASNTSRKVNGYLYHRDSTGTNPATAVSLGTDVTVPADTWTQVSGYITTPAGYDLMIPHLMSARPGTAVAGDVFYFSNPEVYEVSEATNLASRLFGSLSSAVTSVITSVIPALDASKITSGTFAQSMITGLTNLVSLIRGGQVRGSNLVTDPAMTDSVIWSGSNFNGTLSTEQRRSGTQSNKITGASGFTYYLRNESDRVFIETQEGEKFYCEAWIYPHASNGAATGNFYLGARLRNSVTSAEMSTSAQQLTTTLVRGQWQKASGYITIPAGYDRISPYYQNNGPAGDIYYVDDPAFREVTESQNIVSRIFGSVGSIASSILTSVIPGLDGSKIVSGTISQTFLNITSIAANLITGVLDALRIPSLDASKITTGTLGRGLIPTLLRSMFVGGSDLSNQMQDGGFESNSTDAVALATGASIVTIADPPTGGTKALEMASAGAVRDCYMNPQAIDTKPGETWYLEGWVRKTTTGAVGTINLGITTSKDGTSGTNGTALNYGGVNVALSSLTQNVWTKVSIVHTVPAGNNRITVRPSVRDSIPTGQTIQFDDIVFRKATPADIVTGVLGTGNIPGLDGSKIISGSISQTFLNITSIGASLITGVLDALRIPSLDASKITTGSFAQSMVTGLSNMFNWLRYGRGSGSNILPDPGMNNIGLWPASGPASISNVEKHSGTHSLRLVGDGTTYVTAGLTRRDDGSALYMEVRPGEKYFAEGWAYSPVSNTGSGNAVYVMVFQLLDSTGVLGTTYQNTGHISGITKGSWTKYNNYITVPAGYDRMYIYAQVSPTATAGDVFYFDDFTVREVTESQGIIGSLFGGTSILSTILSNVIPGLDGSKITSGTISQTFLNITSIGANIITGVLDAARIPLIALNKLASDVVNGGKFVLGLIPNLIASLIPNLDASKITTGTFSQAMVNITSIAANIITGLLKPRQIAIRDYENLLGSGGFEDDNHEWSLPSGVTIATDFAKTGTRSLKLTGNNSSVWSGGTIEVREGEQLYVELWARRSADFSATDCRLRLGGITVAAPGGVNNNNMPINTGQVPDADTWTKVTWTSAAYPADTIGVTPQFVRANATGTLWIDDVVIRRVKKPSWIEDLPGGKIISTLLSSVIPNLDGSKITSGSIAQTFLNITAIPGNIISSVIDALRIPSLDASKVTSGTFGTGLIPNLDASKIISGALDLARIPLITLSKLASDVVSGGKFLIGIIPNLIASLIPNLDASKVTTGSFAQSMITGLTTSLGNLSSGIQGIKDKLTGYVNSTDTELDNWLLSLLTGDVIPLSSIALTAPNLQRNRNFISSSVLVGATGWSLDAAVRRSAPGNGLKTTGGATRSITLEKVGVAANQYLEGGIYAQWSGITGTNVTAQLVLLQFGRDGEAIGSTVLRTQTLTGTSTTTWTELKGEYGVADNVFFVALQLVVTNATAGNIWFSDARVEKQVSTGMVPIPWIQDLPDALDGLAEFAQKIGSTIMEVLTGIPFVGWIFTGLRDAFEDFFDDTQVTAQRADDAWLDVRATIGHVVEAVFGNTSTNPDDARSAVDTMYAELLENSKKIDAMLARDSGEKADGQVITIDFGDYPDGPLTGLTNSQGVPLFAVTYTGPGTSSLIIDNGVAQWDKANNANRAALVRYAIAPTDTDFQVSRGTMAAPPEDSTSSGRPHFYALNRLNTTGTERVWARAWSVGAFFSYKCDIGCTIGGVDYVWVADIPLAWSLSLSFVCGVGNNPRQYQVFSGSKLVYTYLEADGEVATYATLPTGLGAGGAGKKYVNLADGRIYTWNGSAWSHPNNGTAPLASKRGANNRYWGSLAELVHDPAGVPNGGGKLSACAVADNELPSVLGTTAMMYRTSTTGQTFSGGGNPLPANFFGFIGRESRDIDADVTNGTITIMKRGSYYIRGRVNIGTTLTSECNLMIQVDSGSGYVTVSSGSGISSPKVDQGLEVADMLHLEPGNVVRLQTWKSGTSVSNVLNGGADGKTIFSATRIPDAMAA